jgi:osomolarity two-component system, sensor histidine kinase SLN1
MRIAIREQLAALVLLAVLVSLAIVSIPTWIYVNKFVIDVGSRELALTASLKASRISSELELVQTSCLTISSRLLIQTAIFSFYAGNTEPGNWETAKNDLGSALAVGALTGLLQAKIYSRNSTGDPNGILRVTGNQVPDIILPYRTATGATIKLSDTDDGYPKALYPNITYEDLLRPNQYFPSTNAFTASAFPNVRLSTNGGLLLGPLVVNDSYALISITVPIRANTNQNFIIAYMTMVAAAHSLNSIRISREGLGDSGIVLLVGPLSPANRFNNSQPASNSTFMPNKTEFGETPVRFILPAEPLPGQEDRHTERSFMGGAYDRPFAVKDYPAAFTSLTDRYVAVNNASSIFSSTNEQGVAVAVGFARTNTALVNWTVIVEQAQAEAYAPIVTLRTILLGCVFGTAGLILFLMIPCAHLSVMPIRRLKAATEKTIAPPGYEDPYFDIDEEDSPGSGAISQSSHPSKKGITAIFMKVLGKVKYPPAPPSSHDATRRIFKIPGKVEERKHVIRDEVCSPTPYFLLMVFFSSFFFRFCLIFLRGHM